MREAEAALLAHHYDAALGLYEQVLAIDPDHAEARELRTTAVKAKVAASVVTATPEPVSGRRLVAGDTVAHAPDAVDPAFAEGFETGPGMEVTKDTQPAALPGRVLFAVKPERLRAGDVFSLSVSLQNTGPAPIEIAEMLITTKSNGRQASAAVTPLARTVAPKQTAVLLSLATEVWPEGVRDWSMDVLVRTRRGETYRNRLEAR